MDAENGGMELYEETEGEFCLDPPNGSSLPAPDDPQLAYQDGFSHNNPFTLPFSEVLVEQMTNHQHNQDAQQLDPAHLNLLNLLNCSPSSSSSTISVFNLSHFQPSPALGLLGVDLHNAVSGSIEPLPFHLNLPAQQPPALFQADHGTYGYGANEGGEVFGFGQKGGGGGGEKEPIRCPKNFVTERQRRQTLNDKFQHLRSLVPNPNKNDRATIVGDAIEYIKELKRTVNELKILVEKKRCLRQRFKRYKTTMEDDGATITNGDTGSPNVVKSEQVDQGFDSSGTLRSSWLQRKCKDTEIDVRIVDDEVTIKLVQRKKMVNCLLYISRTFDELQLDLQHVTGAHVGDYYSFLFSTKIFEGSSVYAGAIANKLIEVVDRQYAVIPSAAAY